MLREGECERDREREMMSGGTVGGQKYQEFIIFCFSLRMADKADQRRISSACCALRAHRQQFQYSSICVLRRGVSV